MTKPENRAKSGQFAPGKSGNPAGRPKELGDIKTLIRERKDELIGWLFDIAEGKLDINADNPLMTVTKPGERTKAIEVLLGYGFGKPTQGVELSGPDGEPLGNKIDLSKLSNEDVERLQQIAAKAKGDDK